MVHLPPQSNPLPSQSYNQPPLSDPQHPDERSYIQSPTVGSWTVSSDFLASLPETEVVRTILLQAYLAHADRLNDVSALERPCPRPIFQ